MTASFPKCENGTYRLVFDPLTTTVAFELSGDNSRKLTHLVHVNRGYHVLSVNRDAHFKDVYFHAHSFLRDLGGDKSMYVIQQTHATRMDIRILLRHAAACSKYVRLEGEPSASSELRLLEFYFILF